MDCALGTYRQVFCGIRLATAFATSEKVSIRHQCGGYGRCASQARLKHHLAARKRADDNTTDILGVHGASNFARQFKAGVDAGALSQ